MSRMVGYARSWTASMTVFLLSFVAKLVYKMRKFRLEPAEIYPEVNSKPKNIICIVLLC